ncbi:unnamed protein product [Plutella xylostella]|uniref:(diamondback moth) hypothetical protein n=1 Tax=Plutella xylostella TaxID=51655 RepID=A0A8S4FYD4_PLUXY|nr:unnamed protein product [Plutella xylostella]
MRYGWLYTKILEREKYLLLQKYKSYDQKVDLPPTILQDLYWWNNNVLIVNNPIKQPSFDLTIYTDASRTGWGAYSNDTRVNGGWKDEELGYHINYLELLSVFFALKYFAKNRFGCSILLRVDNTTAISYINRMGGIQFPHLNALARDIWQWCEKRNIWLHASDINTKENVEADEESRKINSDVEWELSNSAFEYIVQQLGRPELDLFASRTNAKCRDYVSWYQDPDAVAVDAFTISWQPKLFYAFPPFCLILNSTTLVDYISFTKELRSTSSDHLLITVKRPHRNATAQSISRWIKQVLQESGVDAVVFSAHSARHAATSAAHSAGLSLDLIRKTAGWTASSSTFAKYYKRPLLQQSNFAKAVCIPNNSSS